MHFGSDELKKRVVPDCLAGRKNICLAITEPYAGSDVANIKTEAKKTADGKHFIVSKGWTRAKMGLSYDPPYTHIFISLGQWREKVDYKRYFCRLLYSGCSHGWSWNGRNLFALDWTYHAWCDLSPNVVFWCLVVWYDLYYFRGCQGSCREYYWTGKMEG